MHALRLAAGFRASGFKVSGFKVPASQTGVALFISLVLLLVLTIIGVSAVQTTSLEVRMARNDYDSLLAFQAAESALRDAETAIEALLTLDNFDDTGTLGLWEIADLDEPPRWETADWNGATSVVAASAMPDVSSQPRYIIERAATVQRAVGVERGNDYDNTGAAADSIEMFRITARGVGGTDQAVVMLQSVFGRIID